MKKQTLKAPYDEMGFLFLLDALGGLTLSCCVSLFLEERFFSRIHYNNDVFMALVHCFQVNLLRYRFQLRKIIETLSSL